jgi:signal transduction histidine kinase
MWHHCRDVDLPPQLSSRSQIERVIAGGRVALAAASLVGVWWGPAQPAERAVAITYTLSVVYLAYAFCLLAVAYLKPPAERMAVVTHAGDIVFVSILQYLTLGPSSPFFLYFVFSIFGATLRWDWKGTLVTAAVVLTIYVIMTAWMTPTLGPSEFEGYRFVIRCMYLVVVSAILVYLSRHHARLRAEISRLAQWPQPTAADIREAIFQLLEHAARIVNAGRVVAIWDAAEEPDTFLASWPDATRRLVKHPPGSLEPLVSAELDRATFVAVGPVGPATRLLVTNARGSVVPSDGRLRSELLPLLTGVGLASAPFQTERVSGRVFFTGFATPPAELIPLTEVVAREIGASLDRLFLTEQLKAIAALDERIRLARDLHDGVLQSLTGIRLEIGAVAGTVPQTPASRDRLVAVERAIALEQRELRLFIEGLGPTTGGDRESLAARLDDLRERIALEWKMPVTIRCNADHLPDRVESDVLSMVHEAIVNALKHGHPSRVAVTLDRRGEALHIVVADDGRGFPFRGRYDQQTLTLGDLGPKSLLERVRALGGAVSIESTDAGSRVEMVVDLSAVVPT